MFILKCVYKSREINIGFLEFSSCFDSSKLWQSHSLIHKLIVIPHQNMYNDIMPRHWYFLYESSIEKAIGLFQKKSAPPRRMGSLFNPPSHLDFLKHKTPPSCLDFQDKTAPSRLDFREKIRGLNLIYF